MGFRQADTFVKVHFGGWRTCFLILVSSIPAFAFGDWLSNHFL